jgi:hypothetical protein
MNLQVYYSMYVSRVVVSKCTKLQHPPVLVILAFNIQNNNIYLVCTKGHMMFADIVRNIMTSVIDSHTR